MDKNTEIKTLQSLKGDTYFSQYFSKEDIDTTCENIKNDFAIECSIEKLETANKLANAQKKICELDELIESYNKSLTKRDQDLDNLAIFMAEQAQKWAATDLRDKAIEMMGAGEYIKFRLRKGWDLWESDKAMLIKML